MDGEEDGQAEVGGVMRMNKPGRATTSTRMDRENNDKDGCIAESDNKDGQVGESTRLRRMGTLQ